MAVSNTSRTQKCVLFLVTAVSNCTLCKQKNPKMQYSIDGNNNNKTDNSKQWSRQLLCYQYHFLRVRFYFALGDMFCNQFIVTMVTLLICLQTSVLRKWHDIHRLWKHTVHANICSNKSLIICILHTYSIYYTYCTDLHLGVLDEIICVVQWTFVSFTCSCLYCL